MKPNVSKKCSGLYCSEFSSRYFLTFFSIIPQCSGITLCFLISSPGFAFGVCNFFSNGNITEEPLGISDSGSIALTLSVNNASSSFDLTLRYFGLLGSKSIFWSQVYFLFFFLLAGGLILTTSKSFTSQGSVLDCGFATQRQGPLVTLTSAAQFSSASREYIAAAICLQPPSLPPLHLHNASITLPLFGPFPSKINHRS